MKNVKCARCVRCGKEYEAVPNLTNCSCGGILDIVYDYDYIKAHFTKETLKNRVNLRGILHKFQSFHAILRAFSGLFHYSSFYGYHLFISLFNHIIHRSSSQYTHKRGIG